MNKTGRSDIPDRPVVLLTRNMEFSMKVIHLHAAGYIFDFALSARGQAAIGIKYSRASFTGESKPEMAQKTGRQDGRYSHDQPDFPRFHKNTAFRAPVQYIFPWCPDVQRRRAPRLLCRSRGRCRIFSPAHSPVHSAAAAPAAP